MDDLHFNYIMKLKRKEKNIARVYKESFSNLCGLSNQELIKKFKSIHIAFKIRMC
jgi:hypothetical protein